MGGIAPATLYVGVLLIGQSNMRSNCGSQYIDPAIDTTNPKVLQWSPTGQGDPAKAKVLLLASEPLLHGGSYSASQGPGLGLNFGKDLAATLPDDQRVVLIPCALEGSPVSSWTPPSGANYVIALDGVTSFLAAYPNSEIRYILNLQGEADIIANTPKATYLANQTAMFNAFRAADARANNAIIVAGQMLRSYIDANGQQGADILDVHRTTPLRFARAWFQPESDDPNHTDSVHYGAAKLRQIGHDQAASVITRNRAVALTTAAPPTPTNPVLEARTIKFGGSDAPAYVIQTSPVGANTWTDTVVYPLVANTLGDLQQFDIPGTGELDVRVKARSYGGDSAPTATLTYRVPVVTIPTRYWNLDNDGAPVDGNGVITSVASIGSDATAWSPVGSIKKVAINGKNALDISTAGMQLKRTGTFPAGTFTHLSFYSQYVIPDAQIVMSFGDGSNYGPTTLNTKKILNQNVSQVDIAYTQTLATGKFYCVAWTADESAGAISAGNNGAIYLNGVEKVRGNVRAQQYTAANQRLFGRFNDANTEGLRCYAMSFQSWNQILTQDQIGAVMAEIATAYGVTTWG